MRTVMLVGRTSCGKTTFCQALAGLGRVEKKTQMVEIVSAAIDTPGEFLENRRLYKALLVTAAEAEIIAFMQDSLQGESMFPPGFAAMFSGKPVFGLVSKADVGTPESTLFAERVLREAGADPIFRVNSLTGEGVEEVRRILVGTTAS